MSSSNLIRWSGLAALVGGVLVVVYDVLDAALFPGEQVSGWNRGRPWGWSPSWWHSSAQ
jgi:hypothetical protein